MRQLVRVDGRGRWRLEQGRLLLQGPWRLLLSRHLVAVGSLILVRCLLLVQNFALRTEGHPELLSLHKLLVFRRLK